MTAKVSTSSPKPSRIPCKIVIFLCVWVHTTSQQRVPAGVGERASKRPLDEWFVGRQIKRNMNTKMESLSKAKTDKGNDIKSQGQRRRKGRSYFLYKYAPSPIPWGSFNFMGGWNETQQMVRIKINRRMFADPVAASWCPPSPSIHRCFQRRIFAGLGVVFYIHIE